jgi:glycosyltransferase involved in cell wall biosynthesis
MNILFIAPRQHTNYLGILRALKKNKHKVFFNSITKSFAENNKYAKPQILKQSLISKILVFFFGKKKYKFYYLPNFYDFFLYLKKIKPDIALLRIGGRLNFYFNLLFLSFFRCKILCHEQKILNRNELKYTNIKNFFLYIESLIIYYFFNVRWFSPVYKTKVNKFFFFLPFVTDTNKKNSTLNNKYNFISIGKFVKRKSFDLLLSALKKTKIKYKLLIIGEKSSEIHIKYYKLLQNYIALNNLQKNVKVISNIKPIKMNTYFKNKSLFILPSYDEPAAISVLESISMGVPAICSDTCGTKVYIKENFNGFVFKSKNVKSLANKINFYLNSKKKFKYYSRNCIDFSRKNLSDQNFMNHFNKIIFNF